MSEQRRIMNRREAMAVGATAAATISCGARWVRAAESTPKKKVTIGVATFGFGEWTNRQLAQELAKEGIQTVQLFLSQSDSRYWAYNGRSDVSSLTDDRCKAIADDYRSAGISIHSLGVYTNLIHPDAAERQANLDYFEAMMRIARSMGVGILVTEAGHYQSAGPEPEVPYYFQEPVWAQTVETVKRLAERADRHDVTVIFEPFHRGFLASAKRTRVFLEEVDSPRIKALLDVANLLEVNDQEEMFGQLRPWILAIHAKDRKLHVDRGVPAGQGDVDHDKFVRLAAEHAPDAPLILEYVGAQDYRAALGHLRAALGRAGLEG